MPRSHPRRRLVPLLALLGLAAFAGPTAGTVAATDPAGAAGDGPTITVAATLAAVPGTVTVTGEGFTPGGAVYVALYDVWGAELHETLWTTASRTAYGPNGSADPALGFRRGGALSEVFQHLCGATAMVRAFDRQTDRWSNWRDVDPGCAPLV
jgi:hypothetical protein